MLKDEVVSFEDDITEGMVAEKEPSTKVKTPMDDMQAPAEELDLLQDAIEKQVVQLGRATAELLKKDQKIKFLVPLDPLNRHITDCWAGINGWNFRIMRGKPVLAPKSIYDLLVYGGYNPTVVP